MEIAYLQISQGPWGELGIVPNVASSWTLELIEQHGLKWVLDRRNVVQPAPVNGYAQSLQEESTGKEEECSRGNYNCVSRYVTGHKCTYKHYISICSDKRCKENQPEVQETATQVEHHSGDDCESEALNCKEREIDDERGDNIRRGTISIVGCFSHEDESLLDECGDCIVGGEENEADGEDVEIQEPIDGREIIVCEVLEEGGQNESHYS